MADDFLDSSTLPTKRGVILPLDGSALAEQALRYAAALPTRFLRLLAVEPVDLSAARERWANDDPSPWGTWPIDDVRAYLELIAQPFREQGREVEVILRKGEPGPHIVGAAKDSELIVMSTRGNGLTRKLLGTTADYVLDHASVPTLLVRDVHPSVYAIFRVVVPLDGSERGDEAAPLAAMFCTGLGAELHLVRVVDPSTSLRTADELVEEANAYLDIQKFRLADAPLVVTTEVRIGTPDERLLDVLSVSDLVLMATRGHVRQRKRLLGDVSTALLDRAPIPVLVLRAAPGETTVLFDIAREGVSARIRE